MTAPFVKIVATDGLAHNLGPGFSPVTGSNTGAVEAETAAPASPWGRQKICDGCQRGEASCICPPWPGDDELMPASDVSRIMADLSPDSGWARAERSAYMMGGKR